MGRSALLETEPHELDTVGKKRTGKPEEKPRVKPNRTKVPLHVEIVPALRSALDTARKQTRRELNEVVAMALEEHLERLGFWPPADASSEEE